jgi:hypothetical protein
MSQLPTIKVKILGSFPSLEEFFKTLTLDKSLNLEFNFQGKPDLIIFGDFGFTHEIKHKDVPRIYWKSEMHTNISSLYYDYCFGYCQNSQKHTYVIDHCRTPQCKMFIECDYPDEILSLRNKTKTKFCNFTYSATGGLQYHVRENFCKELMEYKHIDCPGKVFNNIAPFDKRYADTWYDNKLKMVSDYKFTIAFENQSVVGYVTEKFFHPLKVRSIPIYWGDPEIGKKFNTKAFINCHDYNSFDEVIEHIIEVDNNDVLYQSYLNEAPFLKDKFPPPGLDIDIFKKKLVEIITKLTSPEFKVPKRPLFPVKYLILLFKPKLSMIKRKLSKVLKNN